MLQISHQVVLLFLLLIHITVTKSTPLPHPYDHNESKKDIFMSRGWGASGMPVSMFYLNQYIRQQERKQQEVIIRQQQQRRQQELIKMDTNTGSFKASRLMYDDEKPRADNRAHNKNFSMIPQLFVSYGWGPMGTG